MMLLDANVCIDVLRGRADVVARLTEHGPAGLFLCALVKAAQAYGAWLAAEPERAAALVDRVVVMPAAHSTSFEASIDSSPWDS
jgi:predicted nucleic acid-binding protein